MFSVIEGEEHFEEKEYKSVRKRSSSSPNKDQVKTRLREEDQSVISSGDCYQVGYRDIHSKQPCKDVSRSQVKYHHPRHQAQAADTSLSSENLLYSTEDKLAMDSSSSVYPPKKPTKPYRKKKKLKAASDRRDEYSLHSDVNDQTESGSENGFALKNVCNNSNGGVGGISCWDEVRKSICPEEAKILPSAAFLEHDIISKQRKEILLLMEELGTRDQELNDLVRSHQSQVKAWESDRYKLKDLQQRLSNYEKELERSDDNLQLTLEEMKKVTDQKELDGLELKKTKGEMEKLSRKIQENSSYLKDMESQNKNLMDSVKKLVSVKEDLEIRGKNLSSRLKSKAGELNVQASEISRLNDQNKNLESKLANGNETIRNLKAEVGAWKNRYCSAKDETDRLTTDNTAKDAQIQNLTAQLHETLQQTLALQKALFTSCEREKCKEEIMLSLRKQQKRTMQEMTNLRKLYEKQTKDLKLYHLSVQDGTKGGDKGHAGQGEMDDSCGPGLEKHCLPSGHKGEKTSTKAHDQSQHSQGTNRGRQSERKHRSSSDKNMSYNKYKPNFLRYESRDQASSFLVKKERDTPSPQASQENEIGDERKAFICSVHSDLENSDASSGKDHQCNASSLLGGKADKENGNESMSKKRKEVMGDTDFTLTLSSRQAEKLNRRSKSLSSETKGNLTKTTHCRPLSCSRGTSPINLGDRAISPTTHFFTAHENSASLNSDMNILSDDLKICKSNSNKGDVLRNGQTTVEESKHDVGLFKDIVRDAWSGMKRAPLHNETSGVCLSSSECSSSTLSSVGRERALDELTPADSDGMCSELQRKFVPSSHKSTYSLHDRSDVKTNFIYLRNTPTVIEDTQGQSHTSDRTRYFSDQRDGVDGSVPKANKFVGRAYRLVDKKENEDSTVVKEKWSERSSILNSSIGLCRESEKINGHAHAYDHGDVRTDLSSGHKDSSCVVNRQSAKLSSHQVSNLDTSNHKTPCENNNRHSILKVASENNDSKLGYRTQSLSLTHGIDNSSLCQQTQSQSRHLSSQFNNDRDKAKDNMSRVDNIQSRLQSRPPLIGRCVRVISPLQDDPETKAQCDMWSKGATTTSHHQNASQSDSSCLESDTSLYSMSTKSNYSCLKESANVTLTTPPVFNASDNNDHKIQPHSFERQNRSADLIQHKVGGSTDNNNCEDKKRNYFYEENESTDSENAGGGCKPRDDRILANNNAYIVPVSSSTCSRPFLSTKGPSLYNHLSTIHYSEKSRRYEWGPNGSGGQESVEQQKENYLRLHQQGKQSFVTFPKGDAANKPSTSGNDPLRRSCTNNNNSSTEELGDSCTNNNNSTEELLGQEEEELIDNLFQDASLRIVSSAVYHPDSNMDKFHHHYNNIVRKLGGSNVDTDDESLEDSVDSGHPIFPLHPGAPERLKTVTKRSEMGNMKSDESIFSPSQICVKVSMTENSSVVVDNNIVRQLDFSNMTCVDQSHLDLVVESPCASQFSNIFGLHSVNNKNVPTRQRDQNAEKMNIPLDCPSTVCRRHTPIQNHTKQETDLIDADNNGPLNDTSEANVEFQNISLQPDNKPFWNLCDGEEQMKLDKVKILSMVGETNKSKTPRGEKPSQETQHRVEPGKDDVELVAAASLPDYFPDISAVVADDDSMMMSVDERGRGGGGRVSGRRHCDDFDDADVQILTPVDDESNRKQQQPYSHTSTPTKARTIPVVSSNCHTINDLNSPLCDNNKHVHNVQEETLLSKEPDGFGVTNLLLLDEENVECSSNVSEIDCDGDGIKKIITGRQSHTKEKDKDRRVIDSEDILISIKETGYKMDMNSLYNDAGYYTSGKSSDRLEGGNERFEHGGTLCSSNVGIKQCNDPAGAITKYNLTNAVQQLTVSDRNGLKEEEEEEDSSYLEGPSWDQMEDRPSNSNYPLDTPRDKMSDDHSKILTVPMSPATKLHHLLLESQEMIRSLEMKSSLPR